MPFQSRLREIPGLLRAEPQFRRYLTARLIGTAARGVLPLYIGYIAATFGVSGRELGLLTTAFVVVQGASGLLWGPLADRLGFKVIFSAALLCWIAGTSLLLVTPVASLTYLVYALVGAGLGGFQLASQNLVLEFGSERDRAMRIATSNSLSELIGSAGFAGAAGMAYWISLDAVFITSIVLQLAALLLIQRVVEPRTHIDPIEVE
jgi:MFS family permease